MNNIYIYYLIQNSIKMKKSLLTLVMVFVASVMAMAQVTTASISGKVSDSMGEVIGATVVAVHTPSGTTYGTTTNAAGRYTIDGMRAGGPYTIKISYVGYETETKEGVQLQLGETYRFNADLSENVETLAETVVVGNAIDATKTGAAMSIASSRIAEIPTVSHSVADIARLSPQVRTDENGAMYFAGSNNRYNAIQIDGAMQNDVFGLTANGANGGQAGTNAFSMETIEQVQVSVAPFDVRQSGFTGGAINAITKSGTNDIHASVYSYFQNQNLISDKYEKHDGSTSSKMYDQTDYTIGATVGGPIIKNKLFFFANYEHADKSYDNAYGPGSSNSKIDASIAKDLLGKVQELASKQGVAYNGTLGTPDEYTQSDKFGVKLDWNINDKHHASLRWSLVDAKQRNNTSEAFKLNTSDYAYDFESVTNSFVAELQSRLSDKMSNDFHFTYTRVRDQRNPGAAFPMISISNVGNGTLNIGNERSSMANSLDQDIISVTDNFSWYLGEHTVTAGFNYEWYQFANLFCQDFNGSYYFNSVDDFNSTYKYMMTNGAEGAMAINRFRFGKGVNVEKFIPKFATGQLGLYVQDKWNVTEKFDVTYGLRIDMPFFFDTPDENATFNAEAKAKGWDYKTNQKLSSAPMWSPRVGFRWQIDEDANLILRGGAGIFTGRVPFVWISNNFSNTGVQQLSFDTGAGKASNYDLKFIVDPRGQAVNLPKGADGAPAFAAQTVNVFNKDFRFPQSFRADVALDYNDPFGIKWTAEAIYSKTINDMIVRKLNYEVNGKTWGDSYGVNFDQRPMLSAIKTQDGKKFANVYALDNVSDGYSYNLSLKAEKSFDFGLDLMASYTYSQSKTINNGSSSVAASNWQYNYTHNDPNKPELAYSNFNVPNQIMASVYYHHNWGKSSKVSNTTTVGLIYSGQNGKPYSIYVNGDVNGDGGSNDLMYIFTDSQIDQLLEKGMFKASGKYTPEIQADNLKKWLADQPYLKNHRGEYYDRNADNEEWENRLDLHIDHKFGIKMGKDMRYLTIGFDVINFTNMLNKKWGATYGGGYGYYNPLSYSGGKYTFAHDANYDMRSYNDFYSRWRGQISVKLSF